MIRNEGKVENNTARASKFALVQPADNARAEFNLRRATKAVQPYSPYRAVAIRILRRHLRADEQKRIAELPNSLRSSKISAKSVRLLISVKSRQPSSWAASAIFAGPPSRVVPGPLFEHLYSGAGCRPATNHIQQNVAMFEIVRAKEITQRLNDVHDSEPAITRRLRRRAVMTVACARGGMSPLLTSGLPSRSTPSRSAPEPRPARPSRSSDAALRHLSRVRLPPLRIVPQNFE